MMADKKFIIKGIFRHKSGPRKFSKELLAATKKSAENKILAFLGSNYGVKRTLVKIESIEEGN